MQELLKSVVSPTGPDLYEADADGGQNTQRQKDEKKNGDFKVHFSFFPPGLEKFRLLKLNFFPLFVTNSSPAFEQILGNSFDSTNGVVPHFMTKVSVVVFCNEKSRRRCFFFFYVPKDFERNKANVFCSF